MPGKLTSRIDDLVEKLSKTGLPTFVKASLEEAADLTATMERTAAQNRLASLAAERMSVEAASITGADRNNGIVLTIPIPSNHAKKWPDTVTHNRGYEPHLTVLYISPEMSSGDASNVLHLVRKVAKTFPPFRIFVDAQSGLQTFGDTDDGEKALWLAARSEPRGELERLHRTIRQTLEREGVGMKSHSDFTPHVTWAYVPNDIDDKDVRRLDDRISDRFPGGIWFDVRHLSMSMPNGGVRAIALSPVPRSSIY